MQLEIPPTMTRTDTTTSDDHQPDRQNWINRHSVTCLLCGGLADERLTIKIREQDTDLWGAGAIEAPREFVLKCRVADKVGYGECHPSCFELALQNGSTLDADREEKVSRR